MRTAKNCIARYLFETVSQLHAFLYAKSLNFNMIVAVKSFDVENTNKKLFYNRRGIKVLRVKRQTTIIIFYN